MCGLAGFTHRIRPSDPYRIRNIAKLIAHRGPDESGVFESDTISIASVRLKILDLEGGQQPMIDTAHGVVLAFNGEIYNHASLRQELERKGHKFHTRSDTEVVLKAFVEWDVAAFQRLQGMFAAAFWNERKKRLVLVRDRMGIKPLYYTEAGDRFYFGSELKTLFEHPEIDRAVDEEALDYYLSLNYVPAPLTMVEGVRKLLPGHWLEWVDGRVRTAQWWNLRLAPDERWNLEAAKSRLDSLLRESVRSHMLSDVPLGVWLSGGLDSSTILHYACESGARMKTFSASFRGEDCDETPWFREVAQHYGAEPYEIDINADLNVGEAIESLVYHADEPMADAGALPVWFLSQLTRSHVTVVLSGEGADELFGGYVTYLADRYARYARMAPAALRRAGLSLASLMPASDEKIGLDYKVRRFLEGTFLDEDSAHTYWNGTFCNEAKNRLRLNNEVSSRTPLARAAVPRHAAYSGDLNRFLWQDQLGYLPDDILTKCDRVSMAHSIEVRPPFLDHRIVEFAGSLPVDLKIRGNRLKFVLRELMKDKLPRPVLRRKKEGFDIPMHAWLRGCLKPLLLDTLSEESVGGTGLFRAAEVDRLVQSHLSREQNAGYHLWGLLVLVMWMKRWRIGVNSDRKGKLAESQVMASLSSSSPVSSMAAAFRARPD